jgi:hypothetical protein
MGKITFPFLNLQLIIEREKQSASSGLYHQVRPIIRCTAACFVKRWVKAQVKPFIDWIWGGCLVMALGGLLAASDRRYRVSVPARRETAEALA